MAVRLTESAIGKAIKDVAATEQRKDLVDAGCPGLRLRLTPAGSKSWVLRAATVKAACAATRWVPSPPLASARRGMLPGRCM